MRPINNFKFKAGDKVKLIEENVKSVTGNELPKWFTNEILTITDFTGENDFFDYPIVIINKELTGSIINNNTLTTYYLKPAIRELRKQKLEKLKSYESRRSNLL